jgi:acyl-CoA thioesterase-1
MEENKGWVYLLNQQLKAEKSPYHVINAAISGDTTGNALARLPAILAKNHYDYVLIELGGNDGLRGFSPKIIKNNLLQIIDLIRQQQSKVILMDIKIPPNYGTRYNTLFNAIFINISAEKKIPLMPFFMEKIAIDQALMQADGIHPNEKAQPLIAEFVKAQLDSILIK